MMAFMFKLKSVSQKIKTYEYSEKIIMLNYGMIEDRLLRSRCPVWLWSAEKKVKTRYWKIIVNLLDW